MKNLSLLNSSGRGGLIAACCAGALAMGMPAHAGDSKIDKSVVTAEPDETLNWITLSMGGMILKGDHGQAMHQLRNSDSIFGGIEDMHFEHAVGKRGIFKLDGHALWGNDDYDVRLELSAPDVGYIRAGFKQYRTWYDGNGGFFPDALLPDGGLFVPPGRNVLALDRGAAWAEFGLRMPDLPEITLRYEYDYRHGQKDSTIWGDTGLASDGSVRAIVPAFRNLNEQRHTVTLDIKQTFGNTDVGLGFRYENTNNNDSLNITRRPAEKTEHYVTQTDTLKSDLFNGRVFAESHLSDKLWLTGAYSYTSFNDDISLLRVGGPSFDSPFNASNPMFPGMQAGDHATAPLAGQSTLGGSEFDQHVAAFNLLYMPTDHLTLTAAVRFEREQIDSTSAFQTFEFGSSSPSPFLALTSDDTRRVAESVELRYTGVPDWVFYARGDWTEETGSVKYLIRDLTTGDIDLNDNIDRDRLIQKYAIGANWYPCTRASLSVQYYHKMDQNSYAFPTQVPANTPTDFGYPALLRAQDFKTDDVNARITLRMGCLTSVTRYDFQRCAIDTRAQFLDSVESGEVTSHILSECFTISPIDRLYVQANFSYVWNQTDTPASITSGADTLNLGFLNNYWTAGCSFGYAIDEKTDVRASYNYYRAADYQNTAPVTVPYGAGAREHGVTVGISRQLTQKIRLGINYAFYDYSDQTSGGHNNFTAHVVSSNFQFGF